MPLTPFHVGPALLLGALFYRYLDIPTLVVGSVIVDVRAALVVFGPLEGPVHGILTTFLGGGLLAVVLAAPVWALPEPIRAWLDHLRFDTNRSSAILGGAVVGVYSHVILDSLLYTDARPFSPSSWNPFLLEGSHLLSVYLGCIVAGVVGLGVIFARYLRNRRAI
jgi:hypothetical protein